MSKEDAKEVTQAEELTVELPSIAVKVSSRTNSYECVGMRFYQKPIQFYTTPTALKTMQADTNLTVEVVQ